MMNGIPNHQQPPMPTGGGQQQQQPRPPAMSNGPPPLSQPMMMNHQMPQQNNNMYGGGGGPAPIMAMPPKQNYVPVPGGGAPPMMPMINKQSLPPVPMNQLPPGPGFPPSSVAPVPVPTSNTNVSRPGPGQISNVQQQQNGLSASSSRTASPHPPQQFQQQQQPPVNRIPSGQMPPTSMMNQGNNNNPLQTPNRLDLQQTNGHPSTLNANFTPLKASTPQYGSPAVGAPPMGQAPAPGQLLNNIQALNQGVQNMNLNYNNGPGQSQGTGPVINGGHQQQPQKANQMPTAMPPTTSVPNSQVSGNAVPGQLSNPGSMPPRPGQVAGAGVPPPMANRYPPMSNTGQGQGQQYQPQQPPTQPQMPPGAGQASYGPPPPTTNGPGMANKYPQQQPPTTMQQQQQPPGMFGTNQQSQQPLQYQNQMPPQPQQQQQMHQYPQQGQGQQPGHQFQVHQNTFNNNNIQRGNTMSVTQSGFNRLWGMETVDLLQNRHILPPEAVQPPPIKLNNQFYEAVNCSPDVFRCTMNKIPETKELLNKSRLPLGVLIHPFRDINKLPVIQCSEIVRCRSCRTYINPFVYFVDSMKWKCNLCYRVNELPKEFQYDPISKTYGDVTRRPEVKSSTIEFIASSEYMLRPPPPAIYLFLLDVSSIAVQSGYLNVVCQKISDHLDELPGDARTQVGFVAYNSAIHFYNMAENFNQPHEITVLDVDDVFLPCPDNLLVNLKECKDLVKDLLVQLPKRFADAHDPKSALGAALQAAFKMIGNTGGRVTVFQTCLPNAGPGALVSREDPNNRSSKEVPHLGPATDYYKRLALECSGQQISVDLFILNSQYSDVATLAGISKYSGGCMHHFPLFNDTKAQQVEALRGCLERYLTRKIGFEAVMRIRCTRGLAIHTFHGNFFVRSTDLLSLPNVNPDAGFAMQIAHEESLTDLKTVCFQAALLYTSSKGERRIRVHTLCLPVVNTLTDVMMSADAQAITGLLVKMGVDRSLTSTLADAREAFINATVDILSAFKLAQNLPPGQVVAPMNLALLPLYINAIMKHIAFRTGTSTRLDDRAFAMCEMKSLPLGPLIRFIYPDFYNIDSLFMNLQQQQNGNTANGGEEKGHEEDKLDPPRLQLSAEKLDSRSLFLMDTGPHIMIYVGTNANPHLVQQLFGVEHVAAIPDLCYTLLNNNSAESEALFAFIEFLNEDKPYPATIQIIRDSSSYRAQFTEKFVDDRSESALSYYEFLQHLRTQVK